MKKFFLVLIPIIALMLAMTACEGSATPVPPRESAGVEQQRLNTENAADQARCSQDGRECIEVQNITERIRRSNDPARVVYVYALSPYTGVIIDKFTCVGKLTSTTKRLEPSESYEEHDGVDVGDAYGTVWLQFDRIQPDGAYGSSTPGQFCFDTAGLLHEIHGESAYMVLLERPYVFPQGQPIDTSIDPRLSGGQIDATQEAMRVRIIEYLLAHPDWNPGEEIPLEVMTGEEK